MINLADLLTGKTDKTLNGITDYISKKAESLTKGFIRSFTLSNEDKMTFINDIYIDLCFSVGDRYNIATPTHNLDNGSVITETKRKQPVVWNLECQFTGEDHKEKYNRLLKLLNNDEELVTLLFNGQVIENLVITNLSRDITKVYYTKFSITLTKLNFVKVAVIPAPQFKKVVSKPTTTNASKKETPKSFPNDLYGDRVAPTVYSPSEEKELLNLIYPYVFRTKLY